MILVICGAMVGVCIAVWIRHRNRQNQKQKITLRQLKTRYDAVKALLQHIHVRSPEVTHFVHISKIEKTEKMRQSLEKVIKDLDKRRYLDLAGKLPYRHSFHNEIYFCKVLYYYAAKVKKFKDSQVS